MEFYTGYKVEYTPINGLLDRNTERKTGFATPSQLITMLQKQTRFTVWSAKWVSDPGTLERITL